MNIIERLRPQLAKKPVRITIVLLAIAIIVLGFFIGNEEEIPVSSLEKAVVNLTSATEYAGEQTLSLIGSVRAFTEADITSERSGRVVSVKVNLGQQVPAGTVLATLENAAESASVLQAEGVYDAAVANAAQSFISVDEANNILNSAENNAISTIKSSYNTTNGIVLNSIDDFFANTDKSFVSLRIDGRGNTQSLNANRIELRTLLNEWNTNVVTNANRSNIESGLDYSSKTVDKVIEMLDTFIIIFNSQGADTRYTEAELIAFSTEFTTLRATLLDVQSSINSSRISISTAKDTLKRAEMSVSGGNASVSDAQVKQALGSLRAAEANYAKTILRTPISGTVNAISIRQGDYINAMSKVAVVANNSALEIVTYISDSEKAILAEGDTVLIEGKYEGIVTQIAPAVDSATRKTEVRIATEGTDITNGDTVSITKNSNLNDVVLETINIPLTAVKFDRENGSVFLVENGALVSRPVKLGNILGSSVVVLEGLSASDRFVMDARGLVENEEVEIAE